MAEYTIVITTNANQERGLDLALYNANTVRLAETPPKAKWNKQQLLQNRFEGVVQNWTKAWKDDLRTRTGAALDVAASSTVTAAAQLLNVDENPYDNDTRSLEAPVEEEPRGVPFNEPEPVVEEPQALVVEEPVVEEVVEEVVVEDPPQLEPTPPPPPEPIRVVSPLTRVAVEPVITPLASFPDTPPVSSWKPYLYLAGAVGTGILLYWVF